MSFHCRADGRADVGFGYSALGQHVSLTVSRAAAVAAHRGHYKRTKSARLEFADHGHRNLLNWRDSAAAHADRHALARLGLAPGQTGSYAVDQLTFEVTHFTGVEFLLHRNELGPIHVRLRYGRDLT